MRSREWSGLVLSSHGGFVIRADASIRPARPFGDNSLIFETEDPADIWVRADDQFGPYLVTTRLYEDVPVEVDASWEDVVEVSIAVSGAVVVTELIDGLPVLPLIDEPGEYRLRVSARGRMASRNEEALPDGQPTEWYLVEAWRAPVSSAYIERLTSSFVANFEGNPVPERIPESAAGLAASKRIGRDVDRGRESRRLSGALGLVRVERTIDGTPRKLFRRCAHLTSWTAVWTGPPGWARSGSLRSPFELGTPVRWYSRESADQLAGSRGLIEWSFVDVAPPHRAVREWNWHSHGDMSHVKFDEEAPVLANASVISIRLAPSYSDAVESQTTIEIMHVGLPVEWLDDMTDYWTFQLAIADHLHFGSAS